MPLDWATNASIYIVSGAMISLSDVAEIEENSNGLLLFVEENANLVSL